MKPKQLLRACVGALAMTFFTVGAAYAAPTYCSAGSPHPDGLAVTDMTLNSINSSDCYGVVSGNINSTTDLNTLNVFGNDWEARITTDGGATTTFEGLQITLSATGVGDTSGTWELAIVDTNGTDPLNLPTTLDLVGALKASDRYALYFFDDILLSADNDGTWIITFENRGGQLPDLSHLDVFIRGGTTNVPEPATLLLLGVGMLGLAGIRRRRQV